MHSAWSQLSVVSSAYRRVRAIRCSGQPLAILQTRG